MACTLYSSTRELLFVYSSTRVHIYTYCTFSLLEYQYMLCKKVLVLSTRVASMYFRFVSSVFSTSTSTVEDCSDGNICYSSSQYNTNQITFCHVSRCARWSRVQLGYKPTTRVLLHFRQFWVSTGLLVLYPARLGRPSLGCRQTSLCFHEVRDLSFDSLHVLFVVAFLCSLSAARFLYAATRSQGKPRSKRLLSCTVQ